MSLWEPHCGCMRVLMAVGVTVGFACCFDPRLLESGELAQTQLARVETLGVQKELKDVDLCQRISYIAHILQVQLRESETGDPGPALPTLPSARPGPEAMRQPPYYQA